MLGTTVKIYIGGEGTGFPRQNAGVHAKIAIIGEYPNNPGLRV